MAWRPLIPDVGRRAHMLLRRAQVDALERRRNDAVYAWQFNRNPFVDNPAWVEDLWGPVCRR